MRIVPTLTWDVMSSSSWPADGPYANCIAGSGFPHSTQNAFEREVINPQKGHIRCERKPVGGRVSFERIATVIFLT